MELVFNERLFNQISEKSNNEILGDIGRELMSNELNIKWKNYDHILKKTKAYYERLFETMKASICMDKRVIKYLRKKENYSKVDIATILFDVISVYFDSPIPVMQFTVLVMRERLDKICL